MKSSSGLPALEVKPQHSLIYPMVTDPQFGSMIEINFFGAEKVCSFNCGYCDLGESNLRMNVIKKSYNFISKEEILRLAIREISPQLDSLEMIAVSGNGEPTLHNEFPSLIAKLKEQFPKIPTALFTNGARFTERKIFEELSKFDHTVLKVDAGSENLFKAVNNPLVRTSLSQIMRYGSQLGNLTVQSFFIEGILQNTSDDHIEEWLEVIGLLSPTKVRLSTFRTGQPLPSGFTAVPENRLHYIAQQLERKKNIKGLVLL